MFCAGGNPPGIYKSCAYHMFPRFVFSLDFALLYYLVAFFPKILLMNIYLIKWQFIYNRSEKGEKAERNASDSPQIAW